MYYVLPSPPAAPNGRTNRRDAEMNHPERDERPQVRPRRRQTKPLEDLVARHDGSQAAQPWTGAPL